MLRKALGQQSWAVVSDWEIRQGGVSYTIDTVNAWKARHPRSLLFWIMGSDQWDLLPSWKSPEMLRRRTRFLVFPRPDRPRGRLGFQMKEISLRIDISATTIRNRIHKGLPVDGLVPLPVEALIRKHRWYR